MSEKSGIELLEEILKKLDFLEKKIDVLDRNIKLLANSKNQELIDRPKQENKPKMVVPEEKTIKQSGFKNFKFEPSAAKSEEYAEVPVKPPSKNVVVSGKMVANLNSKIIPLANISVKIYDKNDKLIKETRTNRAGHWVSHLQPGPYVALFEGDLNGKKLSPQNRNFIVPEGKTEFEVT